jgi:hypothetical protein
MRILLKFPSRGRPQQFLTTLRGWLDMASDLSKIAVLVSYDDDDATMTPEIIAQAEAMHPGLIAVKGKSKSKIDAINRDLPEYAGDWDIVIVVSDDQWCRRQGWDAMIRERMSRYFPDLDGALWIYDGSQNKINTQEIVGRKRWEHFGYIYRPDYLSFFCDDEQSAVGLRDNKLVRFPDSICSHEHPAWGAGMKRDATYIKNNGPWVHDKAVFARRQAAGFPK